MVLLLSISFRRTLDVRVIVFFLGAKRLSLISLSVYRPYAPLHARPIWHKSPFSTAGPCSLSIPSLTFCVRHAYAVYFEKLTIYLDLSVVEDSTTDSETVDTPSTAATLAATTVATTAATTAATMLGVEATTLATMEVLHFYEKIFFFHLKFCVNWRKFINM